MIGIDQEVTTVAREIVEKRLTKTTRPQLRERRAIIHELLDVLDRALAEVGKRRLHGAPQG